MTDSLASPAELALRSLRDPGPGGTRTNAPGGPRPSPTPVTATDFSVEEWVVVGDLVYEPCGLLCGASVFHIGLVGAQRGSGEVARLSEVMLEAREVATGHLAQEATRAGATGVVGVHLHVEGLEDKSHTARFIAVGTGIRPVRTSPAPTGPPFLSSLSGQDFAVLVRGGYLPVGMAMGVCVYRVGRRSPATVASGVLENVELASSTQALYQARELAMARMQAEGRALGADGIVGVTLAEASHVWRRHMIEFFATGTAIRLVADEHVPLNPVTSLSLRDASTATDPATIIGEREHQERG